MKRIGVPLPLTLVALSALASGAYGGVAPAAATTFLPGIVSTPDTNEVTPSFSPSGDAIFFQRWSGVWGEKSTSPSIIYRSERRPEGWSAPEPAFFSGGHDDGDPFVAPDGFVYFTSRRPAEGKSDASADIWRVDAAGGEPERLPGSVNSPEEEYSPVVTRSGNLYFASARPGGAGEGDIYLARWDGARHGAPQALGPAVNSRTGEWNVWVDPGETSLIVESSSRTSNVSISGDLYLSQNGKAGWTPALRLADINTEGSELMGRLAPSGRTLLYTRASMGGHASVHEVDWTSLRERTLEPLDRALVVANAASEGAPMVSLSLLEGTVETMRSTGEPDGRMEPRSAPQPEPDGCTGPSATPPTAPGLGVASVCQAGRGIVGFSGETGEIVMRVALGEEPSHLLLHDTLPLAYVSLRAAKEVVEIDLAAASVTRRFEVGIEPHHLRWRPRSSQSAEPEVRGAIENWPRFRGPGAMPVSERSDLPERWSTTENVEWVAEVPGVGWSSPIVWGGQVFLTSATSDKPMKEPSLGTDFSNDYIAELREEGLDADAIQARLWARDREMPHEVVLGFNLYCIDLETGALSWQREVHNGPPAGGRHRKNSFASETPVTDGERVYVYFAHLGLYAYDMKGELLWSTPMKAYPTIRDYGTGASPVLHGDRIFILDDNEEASFLAAFDKATGKELFRVARQVEPRRKTGWSTPFIWENDLRTEVVSLGPGVVISYSLDGEELWRMHRMGNVAIQSPFAWNGRLYVTSGTGGDENKPIVAIRPGGSGDITPPEPETENAFVVWYNRLAGGTYLPTPLIYDNGLYVLSEKGIFARYDVDTGERVFRARVAPGASAFTASPWAYGGKIFALSEEGDTYVIRAGEEYELVGVNALDDWAMATPAIVGDRLLIRTRDRLYSIRSTE